MNIKPIIKNHSRFENNIKELIQYGLEIISNNVQYIDKIKSKKEKVILLEALLLRTCAHWESFIAKEIILLINMDSTNFKMHMELPENTKLNLKLIRAILYSDKYNNFHEVGHFKTYFSKLLVNEYNPFPKISNEQSKKINFTYTIRHYLSHYSEFSKKKLHKAYIEFYGYKLFQEPGVFLLKEKGKYFENLLHNFVLASVNMKKYLEDYNG
jgi:hypothetical protein